MSMDTILSPDKMAVAQFGCIIQLLESGLSALVNFVLFIRLSLNIVT